MIKERSRDWQFKIESYYTKEVECAESTEPCDKCRQLEILLKLLIGISCQMMTLILLVPHVFFGLHQYKAVALKCLAQGHTHEKPRLSSEVRTQHFTTKPRRTSSCDVLVSG